MHLLEIEVAYVLLKDLMKVASMTQRSTSLDDDARLIPPRINTSCLSILECVDMLPIVTLEYHDHSAASKSAMTRIQPSPPLVILDADDEGRHTIIWRVFDLGGDTSPKLLFSTLIVVSCFPP